MTLVILYISTVVVFLGLDYLGLTYLIKPVFERDIGGWLLDEFRVAPALIFYAFFVAVVLWHGGNRRRGDHPRADLAAILGRPAPSAGLQTGQFPIAHAGADQPQRGQTDMGRHAPHLPVAPLADGDAQPSVRYRLAKTYRRVARPEGLGRVDLIYLCRFRKAVFKLHTFAQRL